MTTAFCEACWGCIQGTRRQYREARTDGKCYHHHGRASALLSAVQNRCRVCTVLWESCSPSQRVVIEGLSDEWCDALDKDRLFMICLIISLDQLYGPSLSAESQPDVYFLQPMLDTSIRDLFQTAEEASEPKAIFMFQPSAGCHPLLLHLLISWLT